MAINENSKEHWFTGESGTKYKEKSIGTRLPSKAIEILEQKVGNKSGYVREAVLKQMKEDGYLD